MFSVALRPEIKNLISGAAEVPEVTGRSYHVIKKICKEFFFEFLSSIMLYIDIS
jgi:hypothetical protein